MPERDSWAVGATLDRRVGAEDARLGVGALLTHGASAINARAGLRPSPGLIAGLVAATGTPGANVTVNAFQASINASRGAGPYIITLDATKTLAILDVPADPSNQRNDLIVAQQSDVDYGDADRGMLVRRVQGTPAGSPVDPTVTGSPDYILLARVRVTAGATTITNAMIDDLRPGYVVAMGGILPILNQTARDGLTGTRYDGFTIYRQDRDWIEVWDGAAWEVQGVAVCSSTADRDSAITNPYNGLFAFTTDTNTLWARAGGAWVEFPNQPRAYLLQTAAQSIPNNTFTAVTFGSEDFDSHNGHDTVTNNSRYTAQRAGKYQLSGGPGFANNATGVRGCYWAKNGTAINGSQVLVPANGGGLATNVAARTIQVVLAVSDYVELHCYQNSGGALNTNAAGSDDSAMSIVYTGA